MYSLDDLLIEPDVIGTKFSCDLAKCKGACCTLPGGGGAPVLDEEVGILHQAIQGARTYLSTESQQALDLQGALAGAQGHWETTCIEDGPCTFVVWDGDIAKCAFEMAHHNGESTFRKPLSCHLFPIRVANFGGPYLRYEQFDECEPGRQHGHDTGTPLVVSVKDALTRAYGEETANAMIELAHATDGGDAA